MNKDFHDIEDDGIEIYSEETFLPSYSHDSHKEAVPSPIQIVPDPTPKRNYWKLISLGALMLVLIAAACAGVAYWRYYYHIGVPVSTTPQENIAKLQRPSQVQPEVTVSSDSILGVAIDIYQLRGLAGEISMQEPDTADRSVVFYTRCADYTSDGHMIGSMVVKGKELESDATRLGYCGMLGHQTVIGISRRDAVADFCREQGGSFFRQFILVSNGTLPPRFFLHGKVERRALARRTDDTLYYIQSRHKETMWDFADALREYGFADAIYITGGTDYCYYRTPDGQRHDIGDNALYPHKDKGHAIPWMVFRK